MRAAFAVSHRFWVVVSSFSFVSRNFLISSLISFFTHSLFNSMLFNLHDSECFDFFPWGCFLISVPCGQRKCLIWFQLSWICWGLFCVLSCGLSLKIFHVHLKKMCILLLWGEKFNIYLYLYQLIPFDLGHWSMLLQYPCWYFVWKIHCSQWGPKIP